MNIYIICSSFIRKNCRVKFAFSFKIDTTSNLESSKGYPSFVSMTVNNSIGMKTGMTTRKPIDHFNNPNSNVFNLMNSTISLSSTRLENKQQIPSAQGIFSVSIIVLFVNKVSI